MIQAIAVLGLTGVWASVWLLPLALRRAAGPGGRGYAIAGLVALIAAFAGYSGTIVQGSGVPMAQSLGWSLAMLVPPGLMALSRRDPDAAWRRADRWVLLGAAISFLAVLPVLPVAIMGLSLVIWPA